VDKSFVIQSLKQVYPFKDQRPMERGWQGMEREGAPCASPIAISKLEAVVFHKEGEDWVFGEEMMRRATDVERFPGCQGWGQHAAEDILSRAAELPAEWANEQGPALLSPDTVLVGKDGRRRVPYLVFHDGGWQLNWGYLDDDFSRYCRFVRLRPPAAKPSAGGAK